MIDAVDPTRQHLVEQVRLKGVEIPHPLGTAHCLSLGPVSEQRGADLIVVSGLALPLWAKIVGDAPARQFVENRRYGLSGSCVHVADDQLEPVAGMMPGTQAISMAAQHLDRQNLLVKFQSRDPFFRHAVKRDELGRHCPGVLEARGADALHLDAEG